LKRCIGREKNRGVWGNLIKDRARQIDREKIRTEETDTKKDRVEREQRCREEERDIVGETEKEGERWKERDRHKTVVVETKGERDGRYKQNCRRR
jgi:hypothetical protein